MSTNEIELKMGAEDFANCLRELSPGIGGRPWIWTMLRAASRIRGRYPRWAFNRLKRFFRPDRPLFVGRTADGTSFLGDYRDFYSTLRAIYPAHERHLTTLIEERLGTTHGIFVDIGANMGVISAPIARSLPEVNVLAFEPVPATAQRAAATFALNGLANVRLFQSALGSEDGELTLLTAPGQSAISSRYRGVFLEPYHTTETTVTCRTLDSIVEQYNVGRIGFLKVDVEGHELDVFRGAQRVIARDRPEIIFEYNPGIAPAAGWSAQDAVDLLNHMATYHCQVLNDDGTFSPFPPLECGTQPMDVYCTPVPAEPAVAGV